MDIITTDLLSALDLRLRVIGNNVILSLIINYRLKKKVEGEGARGEREGKSDREREREGERGREKQRERETEIERYSERKREE